MYVFALGAGCTGPTHLVRPGDKLIFNSMYNPSDWTTENSVKTEYEEGNLANTCPGGLEQKAVRNFKEPLPKEELAHLSHKNFSKETLKQVRWVRKMYREWQSYRISQGLAFIACDLEDKATITAKSLNFALCRFITEVKKIDGQDLRWITL